MDTPRFSLRVEVGDEWGEGSMRNKASRSLSRLSEGSPAGEVG